MKFLLLAAIVVLAGSTPSSLTWNEFLNAENIFPPQNLFSPALADLASKADDAVTHEKIVQELTTLLSRPEVLHQLYVNYLTTILEPKVAREVRHQNRKEIVKHNLIEIALQNIEYRAGRSTWYAGVTSMLHMTENEFQQKYLSSEETPPKATITPEELMLSSLGVPSKLDYRDKGIVTPVKSQSSCGVCYAFQAVAILESGHANMTGELLDLSEEDIRDCGNLSRKGYCHGSSGYQALNYIQEQGGLPLEKDYPYHENGKFYKCTSQGLPRYVNVSDFQYMELYKDESTIIKTLVEFGIPIGVSVWAHPWKGHYKGGVFYHSCDEKTSHAVTLVGYDEESYFVKNSWGDWWGDKGYIYLKRGGNNCCIASHITFITQM